MMRHSILAFAFASLTLGHALAEDGVPPPAPAASTAPIFDTSYRPSAVVTARVQRKFLEDLRWSSGVQVRDALTAAFAERSPAETWRELVEADGLTVNNVTDALTAYWVLNWITANGAYETRVDHEPIRRQLAAAFAGDANFLRLSDLQKQELAEGYILNFLLQHAALNEAVRRRDSQALYKLAVASLGRFRQDMGVNLLALAPGPDGFAPRRVTPPDQTSR